MPLVLLLAPVLVMLGLMAWSAMGSLDVARSAAVFAGQQPFCIQTGGQRRGYKPALGLNALSPFAMKSKSRGLFHGVLVVDGQPGPTLYNWSRAREQWDFLPDRAAADVTIRCLPRRNFTQRMTWWPDRARVGQPDGAFVRIGDRSYLIAPDFRGQVSQRSLFFQASTPDFLPVPDEGQESRMRFGNSVEFRSSEWMLDLLERREPQDLDSAGSRPTLRPDKDGFTFFVGRDERGVPHTVVLCTPQTQRNPMSCQHRFYTDGAMWTFSHRLDQLQSWREMQAVFRARVDGFAEAGRRAEEQAFGDAATD
ncbi:hypothetical protein [Brevundimonas staleyi]|uniref:hypothetical protein n=1 Tax=Brevundimonas staleyi TaxID=74326 RepID=UPI003671F5B7